MSKNRDIKIIFITSNLILTLNVFFYSSLEIMKFTFKIKLEDLPEYIIIQLFGAVLLLITILFYYLFIIPIQFPGYLKKPTLAFKIYLLSALTGGLWGFIRFYVVFFRYKLAEPTKCTF